MALMNEAEKLGIHIRIEDENTIHVDIPSCNTELSELLGIDISTSSNDLNDLVREQFAEVFGVNISKIRRVSADFPEQLGEE